LDFFGKEIIFWFYSRKIELKNLLKKIDLLKQKQFKNLLAAQK
jgi:hypothetical protein